MSVSTITRLPATSGMLVPMLTQARDRFLRLDRFAATTAGDYRKTLDVLLAALGDVTVDRVSGEQLQDLLDNKWGTDTAATARTYNRHRAALGSFFGWAVKRGWRLDNPIAWT